MAYVTGCQHDLFVSYAHVDDEAYRGVEAGWVSTLVEDLLVSVNQEVRSSGKVDIWMDHQLAGNAPLTETLLATLRETATLLVVLSRRYMTSVWCEREREAFLEMVDARSQAGSRVFLVVLDPIPIDERPPEFRELLGYDFWVQDPLSRRTRRLGVPQRSKDEAEYWSKLDDLARDLAAELDRIHNEAESSDTVPTAREAPAGSAVFLAQATEDIMTKRDEVARSLTQAGFRVLPDANARPYPREAEKYEAAVKADLGRCGLYVQLLSALTGRSPFWTDLPQGFVRAQYDWACESKVEIMQWRDRTLEEDEIADQDHLALLRKPTVQKAGLEEFKQAVERKLRAIEKVRMSSAAVAAMVHVNADSEDQELTDAICAVLDQYEDAVGYDLEEIDDLEYVCQSWDGIIFVYGKGKTERVSRRVRKWYKTLAGVHPCSFALYVGPPSEKSRLSVKPPGMVPIDGRQGLNEDGLLEFIAAVRREKLHGQADGGARFDKAGGRAPRVQAAV